MINKEYIVIVLKDGTQIIDGCYLADKDMAAYVEKRVNPFKGMLVGDSFAVSKDDIKMMFFKDEAVVIDKGEK
ncbi:hypothetical protein BCPG3_175 [Bacillus phage BCPG3]|uniref:hypothetical protein n=1 Tax=Bacillus thuringiensis TaxID=1428 RepID=UPI000A3C6E94|nr:hypothetical protein [Bacillus thuringiensis]OTZ47826.1 hypothetical protein BK762_19250 [Bacillus thuringiensis serovar toumanoffi]QQO38810.1 terminase large subunit [Bacillus phage BCPG1]QSJ04492.1 hypothetical protein BCPG3_175 [Bacillus phage BCPG3]QSJ04702.1 terminase large subunit [Bacillus phage BCP18]